jgi:hypothetical protein
MRPAPAALPILRAVLQAVLRRSLSLLAVVLIPLLTASPATATFHLNEITKVMASFDGDTTIQAIEFKMLAAGENLVSGKQIKVYDRTGALLATLASFPANLGAAGAVTGAKFLVATNNWQVRFGLTPDFIITPGIRTMTGQVSFEDPTGSCLVDAVSYGDVSAFVLPTYTNPAPYMPKGGCVVLQRTIDNPTIPSCPMNTDGPKFQQRTANANFPIAFQNYAGSNVLVQSTATGVDPAPGVSAFRIAPNPVREALRIESPGGERVAVYDARGRLVRTVLGPHSGPVRATWNGTDDRGRPLASGVYFIRQERAGASTVRRFVIAR